MLTNVSDDPLDEALRPPSDETPEQRIERIEREAEAKRVSLAIDATIKAERQARRRKRIVRLLLLGQSESGKSTTLRQFQRLYTPTAFREERILWRAVIQLNIVRSIRTILETLALALPQNSSSGSRRARSTSHPRAVASASNSPHFRTRRLDGASYGVSNENYSSGNEMDFSFGSPPKGQPPGPPHSPPYYNSDGEEFDVDSDTDLPHPNFYYDNPGWEESSSSTIALTPLDALKARLAPLEHIEALLVAKLVPPNEDEPTQLAPPGSSYLPSPTDSHFSQINGRGYSHQRSHSWRNQEVFIRPGHGWKGGLARARVNNSPGYPTSSGSGSGSSSTQRPTSAGNTGLETPDEAQEVLNSCRDDMMRLWHDEGVRDVLRRKKVRLEEGSGFFLDDLDRVTAIQYMPSDDDVLKARLKTVGVSEYKFEMEVAAGRDSGTEWRIVDVGGSRSQRPTWAPFFDDVDAIIFLAPISGFDQVLSEDKSVNRLEDSVLLWKAVCSSKILANVDLVLFLNKCDILERKLNSGVRLSKYIRSYGDRENNLDTVSKYLRGKFGAIHREYSPNPRKFYCFCTSVTDPITTSGIIASVRDMVIRQHLKQSKLL